MTCNGSSIRGAILVTADRDKLLQAIRNLADNAWKYTPRRGSVTISTQRTADGIKTVFTNSGAVIAEKDIPYLFERFFRADRSRSRDAGGAGIGLAIVKELIEAHGGTVGAESDESGTRVWFICLPAKPKDKHTEGVLRAESLAPLLSTLISTFL